MSADSEPDCLCTGPDVDGSRRQVNVLIRKHTLGRIRSIYVESNSRAVYEPVTGRGTGICYARKTQGFDPSRCWTILVEWGSGGEGGGSESEKISDVCMNINLKTR